MATRMELCPGECPECGSIHADDGTPDEHGNRFVPEYGRCNNCVWVPNEHGAQVTLFTREQDNDQEVAGE